MRCISCGGDIPPEWVHCIQTNSCPGCGNQIMNDDTKELMAELSSAIASMPNDPQGLAGWLMSNYKFKKIGLAEPIEKFHRTGSIIKQHHDGEPNINGVKVASSEYDKFLERTQMASKVRATSAQVTSSKTKTQRIAELASNITTDDMYPTGVEDNDDVSEEDVEAFQYLQAQGTDPFAGGVIKTANHGKALSPAQIAAMHRSDMADMVPTDSEGRIRANVGRNDDLNTLSKEEQALISGAGQKGYKVIMESRLKRIKAQDAIDSGAGSFTRSGG